MSLRFRALMSAFVAVPVALTGGVVATSQAAVTSDTYERRVIAQVNNQRASEVGHGACVDQYAEQWAQHLKDTGKLHHRNEGFILDQCDAASAGEVIAKGDLTPRSVVRKWLSSPTDRAVLKNADYSQIGVGAVKIRGGWIVVANLMRPSGASTPESGTTPTPEPTPETTPIQGLPCTPDSFYRSRVENAPVDQALTDQFHAFMRSHPDQGGSGITWPKVNTNVNWAMSYDISTASDPVWKIVGGQDKPQLDILRTQGFHMSDSVASTFPTGTQDRPGVIFDPTFGYVVQFADAVPDPATRTIRVSSAGIMWYKTNCLDARNPLSDSTKNWTSRGRIIPSMVIAREFLDQAVVNGTGLGHVLHLYFVETDGSAGHVHPMVGQENDQYGFGAEGLRIRLKPGVDLQARGLSGACLAIARTFQENGAYLGDNSGSATQAKGTQPQFYETTNLTEDCMKGKVSWDDFQVVQPGWQ